MTPQSTPAGAGAALGATALAGALFALAQVALAELLGVSTLGAEFSAGNERVQGVQVTLVAWYCAVAVPLAVTAVAVRWTHGAADRLAAAFAAAVGAVAVLPLVMHRSAVAIQRDMGYAVVAGVLLGLASAVVVAMVPVIGRGIAAHTTLWWLMVVLATILMPRTAAYPGIVELLEVDSIRAWLLPVLPSGRILSYHLPYMLPSALATVALSGVLAAVVVRRIGSWSRAIATGTAGPVLAVAAYLPDTDQLYLWNGEAVVIAAVIAAVALLAAILTVSVMRSWLRHSPPIR